MKFDVVIIGGGAAGLMCAIEAGKRGRSVAVLERNETVGQKIRISGGGRCNFTNIYSSSDTFISANPHFHKSALARYTPEDFIRLVRRHHIAYHEKKLGQLFCDGTSQQIIDMLLKECTEAHVEVRVDCSVRRIENERSECKPDAKRKRDSARPFGRAQPSSKDERFLLETNHGDIECESLVIATGGLSIPKMGATDFGYRVAKQFGLRITETHPGLVPFTLDGDEGRALRELAGVSLDAQVSCGRIAFRENILFTHRGLSGPAILQISSYWKPGETILIEPKSYPRRFNQKWKELYGEQPIVEWKLAPTGTEGYAKAEVTVGGIDTAELSSKTMEARRVPGLYFIGEVVDVTGHLGGFNFQWAWASGFVAGQYA